MTRFSSRALRFLSLAAAHALLASSVHPAAKISRVLHLPEPARALSKAHRPVVRSKAQPPVHRDLDHAGIRKREISYGSLPKSARRRNLALAHLYRGTKRPQSRTTYCANSRNHASRLHKCGSRQCEGGPLLHLIYRKGRRCGRRLEDLKRFSSRVALK